VLFTGTPEGVAWASGRFLQPGDVVAAGIDGIGVISNKVIRAT
jgi:2-keto-4-pentenoate hydratase/2-oxohepta-3-ene-1,7-dioic acid hydratase in catechol pathway